MNYFICPFRIVSDEIWYANPDGLQPQEVLSKVTREDFLRQNQKILFTDESREHVFSHVCLFEPVNGIAVMKIANRYAAQDDRAFWYRYPWEDRQFTSVMMMTRKEGLCFVMEDNEKAFSSPQQLLDILCRGLNECLYQEKLAVVPSGNIIRQRDEFSMMSACSVIGRQIDCLLTTDTAQQEVRKTHFDENAILATKLFVSTMIDPRKSCLAINMLYELTKGKRIRKALMCALRAAMDAGVIERPAYNDFIEVFECGDMLSKEQYSQYTSPNYTGYKNYGLYKSALKRFLAIKNLTI